MTENHYQNKYTYLVFATLGAIIHLIYRYQRKRWQLQTALQIQENESLRLKELDVFKSNLYTNITHEFRTPLTVIDGMVELISESPRQYLKRGLQTIRGQSHKLLSMVNQILDLQKIEAGKMEYRPIQADIISYLNYLVEPFQFHAKSKNLDFVIMHGAGALVMDFDPEKLTRIVSNLLSNAIKFTEKGVIRFATKQVNRDTFEIIVRDTGIGMPHDQLKHIFDRFYQAEQGKTRRGDGTGIGLALVKELMPVMHGKLVVESKLDKGSIFIIHLPITRDAVPDPGPILKQVTSSNILTEGKSVVDRKISKSDQTILVVEDNSDVRRYLCAILQDYYKIEEAADGEIGVNRSKKLIPDLIISDVMMPHKDGYQLCEELHEDRLTSHIPIILLTAKADRQSALEGYSHGADVYLSKPFHPEELKAQIKMLLLQRKRLQDKYQDHLKLGGNDLTLKKDSFIQGLHDLILSEIGNEAVSIKDICSRMLVSRSQLHNKIKAVTGFSTSIFIRKIRLEEARKLIRNTDLHISEVAYRVGFEDPNFFTRVYKKEFGESPKEGRR
jgi:signal transduction histidine kinase/DNA-binding response OmpR family regulator